MRVVKYGGHVLEDESIIHSILQIIAELHKRGEQIVLVHGGGPAINKELEIHEISSEMIAGYRKTSSEAMRVVQQVLSGEICRDLTNALLALGVPAVGISAADGGTIIAKKFMPLVDGIEVDIGMVGEPEAVNTGLIQTLLAQGFLPIVSPVAVNAEGEALNLNGDIAAGALAGALGASEVLFVTDVAGIYRSWPDLDSLIGEISFSELKSIAGKFSDGMAPKVKAVLSALASGAKQARVIDGTNSASFRRAFESEGGTVIHL
jgi:acetylglutamate kinase